MSDDFVGQGSYNISRLYSNPNCKDEQWIDLSNKT